MNNKLLIIKNLNERNFNRKEYIYQLHTVSKNLGLSLLEGMAKLDQNDAQNDPEAFSTMMSQLFTPEVMKAVEILEAYSTDVCGIEDGSASSSPPTS